jgi:hypothetical protein
MIDFSNGSIFTLSQCPLQEVGPLIEPLLIRDEQVKVRLEFKGTRTFVRSDR